MDILFHFSYEGKTSEKDAYLFYNFQWNKKIHRRICHLAIWCILTTVLLQLLTILVPSYSYLLWHQMHHKLPLNRRHQKHQVLELQYPWWIQPCNIGKYVVLSEEKHNRRTKKRCRILSPLCHSKHWFSLRLSMW